MRADEQSDDVLATDAENRTREDGVQPPHLPWDADELVEAICAPLPPGEKTDIEDHPDYGVIDVELMKLGTLSQDQINWQATRKSGINLLLNVEKMSLH